MKHEAIKEQLLGISIEGGAGPDGITNKFIIDTVKRDTIYQFVEIFKKVEKHFKVLQKTRFGSTVIDEKMSFGGKLGPMVT